MPALDNTADPAPRRPRAKTPPAGLSADTLYLGEKLEAVEERIASLERKAPSPQMLISAAVLLVVLFGASQVYMVGLIATSRGVDVAPAASATTDVVRAGTTTVVESAGVTTTVETKKTAMPTEPVEAPAAVEP
jgi:hypothetical protein